jgi:hypothetical protein
LPFVIHWEMAQVVAQVDRNVFMPSTGKIHSARWIRDFQAHSSREGTLDSHSQTIASAAICVGHAVKAFSSPENIKTRKQVNLYAGGKLSVLGIWTQTSAATFF